MFIRRISASVRFPRPGEGANENPSCLAVSIVGNVVAVNAVLTGVTGPDECRSWQDTTANNIPATSAAKQQIRSMADPIPSESNGQYVSVTPMNTEYNVSEP